MSRSTDHLRHRLERRRHLHVKVAFEHIFRRAQINAAVVEGRQLPRYNRAESARR